MTRPDLKSLLERVRSAEKGSRELDGAIAKATGLNFGYCGDEGWYCADCGSGGHCGAPLGLSDERTSYPRDWREDAHLPAFSASLDAVVSLIEKELPGWAYGFDNGPKTHLAFVDQHDHAYRFLGAKVTAEAATIPLALLAALLAAKLSMENTDADA
ncbi:hypothetical protein XM25_08065 [Devosia sp. H5989]|nr:hypothetical protein XM25_08065 [Devosia sp. H5989]